MTADQEAVKRYVVMGPAEARAVGVKCAPEPLRSEWATEYEVLVDTKRNVVVWEDFNVTDAPEDMYLFRNLRVFVDELNRLAAEESTNA